MNFLNPTTNWQAENLPDGLSIHNGVISGTPTTAGTFKSSVSVSNQLGSDTKNIIFYVKYKPGTQKFSILQDGEEVAKLTIPELQAMVQDGTAQERFNCTNTQIVLPITTPELKRVDNGGRNTSDFITIPSSVQNVVINFCSFRNATLSDGTSRPGLILQFDKTLWRWYAPFDTGDRTPEKEDGESWADSVIFNRWRYSNLRQWLNSEGSHWFSPAYDGDALVTWQEIINVFESNENDRKKEGWRNSYADDDSLGFLDLLPDDLHSILVPTKVVTQAFFDEDNTNTSIEEPEDVDGYDADITYDKVFIPSLKELFFGNVDPYYYSDAENQAFAEKGVEGEPWEFYIHYLSQYAYITYTNGNFDRLKSHNGEWPYYIPRNNYGDYYFGYSPFLNATAFLENWGLALKHYSCNEDVYYRFSQYRQSVITRTANSENTYGVNRLFLYDYNNNYDINRTNDTHSNWSTFTANPAPAFVIC